jgi:hypothetical protein
MNYTVMMRLYHPGSGPSMEVELGTYDIEGATRTLAILRGSSKIVGGEEYWLMPTEDQVYKVWCRDYRYLPAGHGPVIYSVMTNPRDIGRSVEMIQRMRNADKDGARIGSDYWLEVA